MQWMKNSVLSHHALTTPKLSIGHNPTFGQNKFTVKFWQACAIVTEINQRARTNVPVNQADDLRAQRRVEAIG